MLYGAHLQGTERKPGWWQGTFLGTCMMSSEATSTFRCEENRSPHALTSVMLMPKWTKVLLLNDSRFPSLDPVDYRYNLVGLFFWCSKDLFFMYNPMEPPRPPMTPSPIMATSGLKHLRWKYTCPQTSPYEPLRPLNSDKSTPVYHLPHMNHSRY